MQFWPLPPTPPKPATTSPAMPSPGLRAGSVLRATVPVTNPSAVRTRSVRLSAVLLPVFQEIVKRAVRVPVMQLVVPLPEPEKVPDLSMGSLDTHPDSVPLVVKVSGTDLVVMPGLNATEPLSVQVASWAAAWAGKCEMKPKVTASIEPTRI